MKLSGAKKEAEGKGGSEQEVGKVEDFNEPNRAGATGAGFRSSSASRTIAAAAEFLSGFFKKVSKPL